MSLFSLTHYAMLQVATDASTSEIESAYAARIQQLPKSRVGQALRKLFDGETTEALCTARTTLLDVRKRAAYDREISLSLYSVFPPA
jgi:DnaJ-class molecular chaperone